MNERVSGTEKVEGKYLIPNLQNALVLIEYMAQHSGGLSLPEMVSGTGIPKTTLFRIVNTLQAHNYIYKEVEGNRYFLSRKFLTVGLASIGEESLIEKALVPMRELRDEVKESVLLGALMDTEAVLLEQVIGNHPFTFYLQPGKRFFLHASAPGKIMLAFTDEMERERIIEKMTFPRFNDRTITSRAQFRKELLMARERGYAVDLAEELEGVHCVGAPVLDQNGSLLASVWTTGPSSRIPESSIESIADKVKRCALRISQSFGYQL